MDCNSKEFITAVEAFYEGKSTAIQERMLKDILSRTDDDGMTGELRSLKTLLTGNGRMSEVQFDTGALRTVVADAARLRVRRPFWPGIVAGALAATVMTIVFVKGAAGDTHCIYGYDINGNALADVESALGMMKSMNIIPELATSMDEATYIVSNIAEK